MSQAAQFVWPNIGYIGFGLVHLGQDYIDMIGTSLDNHSRPFHVTDSLGQTNMVHGWWKTGHASLAEQTCATNGNISLALLSFNHWHYINAKHGMPKQH